MKPKRTLGAAWQRKLRSRWDVAKRLALIAGLFGAAVALAPLSAQPVAVAANASAEFHPVVLTPIASAIPTNPSPNAARSWSTLPRGRQTFGGVPFQIDGRLLLTGMRDASDGEFYPARLPEVRLGRKATRLHLLHACIGEDKDGVPLARVTFHYGNGEQRSIRLAYGVHTRDWVRDANELKSDLVDADSRLAWSSANDDFDRPGGSLRLFQSALNNPLPGVPIQHIELVSLFSRATPFFVALTAEAGPAPPESTTLSPRRIVKKSQDLEETNYHDAFVIRVTDPASKQSLTNAQAVLTISDDASAFYFGEARTDATGTIRLSYPPQQTVSFAALVRAPGRVPFLFTGTKTNGGDFPRHIDAALDTGSKIGGIVTQPDGKPVSGAEVVIYKVTREGPRDFTRIDHDTVRTGSDGRWNTTTVPRDFEGFSFHVSHPEHRATAFAQTAPANSTSPLARSVTKENLLGGQATFELLPALRIEGVVADNSNKPVGNVEVHQVDTDRWQTTRTIKSDARGHFALIVPEPGEVGLMFQAPGYRTKFQTVQVSPNQRSLSIAMTRATPFRGRVIDQNQQAVPGARVRLDTWNGNRLLQWQTLADAQGRFVWENPAEGSLMFQISATNYTSTRMSFANPTAESTIRLRKLSRVVGRVVDAGTGKPLDEFTITRGRTYNYNEPMRWDRYDSIRGRRAEYVVRLDDYSSSSGGGSQIMVEAPGYLPAASEIFAKPGLYTNNFSLKKGRGISGVVQLADGSPVANATLALVERSDSASMDRPGELRRNSGGDFQRSNLRGQFEFAAKLEPHTVFAVHEKGFAEVSATNVAATGRVVLKPWGRVKGMVRLSHPPTQGFTVSLQNANWRYGDEGRSSSPLYLNLKAELDASGAFVIDRVPPGERRGVIQFKVNDRENGRIATSHGTPVTVVPNETAEVTIGGEGRPVFGRVTVVGGDPEDVDWFRDTQSLQMQVNLPPNVASLMFTPNMTEEEQRKAQKEYNDRLNAFWKTAPGQALARTQRDYVPLFQSNGTFRVGNVRPGNYYLNISVTNPDRPDNYYEHIGSANKQVTIPPAPLDKPNEPFDLGEVPLQIRGTMRVGKRAPAFEVKTLDGKPLKLADFKGKYVLLDFWATWAGTRTLDVQILKALHEAYAKDDRLVMIGLNFDHELKPAETAIAQGGMKWTQCYVGSWNQSTLPASYGIQGLPETLLIDPEGKIAARNLRGTTIRNAVRNHLSNPRNASTNTKPAP